MKSNFLTYILVGLSLTTLFNSCSVSDAKFKEFGENVGKIIAANDISAFRSVYPDAKFDSIALTSRLEEIIIKETGSDKTKRLKLGKDVWIDVENKDGDFKIVNSRGVAAFPLNKFKIASQCGMIEKNLTDNQIAERMNDNGFFTWMENKCAQQAANAISFTPGKAILKYRSDAECQRGHLPVTVTNNTSEHIYADDYVVNFTVRYATCSDGSSPDEFYKTSAESRDIAPGQAIVISCSDDCCNGIIKPELIIKPTAKERLSKYKPTGKEYREYLASK